MVRIRLDNDNNNVNNYLKKSTMIINYQSNFVLKYLNYLKKKSSYFSSNNSLLTPHNGQIQSSGRSSKAVPGATPASGSPSLGSYIY